MHSSEIRKWQPDRTLFFLVVTLVAIGLAMVFSATSALTLDLGVSPFYFFIKQSIAALIGIAVLIAMLRFDYRILAQPKIYLTLLIASAAMLVLVLFAPSINNTHRWFKIFGFGFQPSEMAKISLIIGLAAVTARLREMLHSWGFIFLTLAVFVAPIVFLVAIEPDLGTAAVVAMASMTILFSGGISLPKLVILLVIMGIAVSIFIYISPYRMARIEAFMNPTEDPLGSGYQAVQSQIALGSGGFLGVGFMQSKQKLFYLPAAHTDFIISVTGEEWGFAGTFVIVCLFLAFLGRGLRIAFAARDMFGFLLSLGITVMIVGQALVNISVAATMLPTKGIPLPLISYGGSSLITMLAAVGLLLNVSQYCDKDKP